MLFHNANKNWVECITKIITPYQSKVTVLSQYYSTTNNPNSKLFYLGDSDFLAYEWLTEPGSLLSKIHTAYFKLNCTFYVCMLISNILTLAHTPYTSSTIEVTHHSMQISSAKYQNGHQLHSWRQKFCLVSSNHSFQEVIQSNLAKIH